MARRLLVTTLAEYQTRFWLEVGLELRRSGVELGFLSFDDRSSEMLAATGLKVFPANVDRPGAGGDAALDETFAAFGIDEPEFWLTHERYAFGRRDSAAMRRKLAATLTVADSACREWLEDGAGSMVQELGGFLSVVGSYFAARKNGLDNWFIEPSFFRGRLFFLKNQFAAMRVEHAGAAPLPEVDRYIEETLRSGAIVIPLKDRHQYTTARRKIVNWRNARRLVEKVRDKHVLGKKQEFGHIGWHVATHARMLLNSHALRHSYTPIEDCGRYVYYPLHVPGDMALTLRTPHLLDQLALIETLCRVTPNSHRVVVKEHPAMVGAVDARRLQELLRRYDNLALVPPSTNNFKVLAGAEAIVSINSKSGAEAGLLGKPVLVLGDAFYRDAPFASPLEALPGLGAALRQLLAPGRTPTPQREVRDWFASVWRQTLPGELYVVEPANVATFSDSLLKATA